METTMEKRVGYAQADGIARITMDDGKLNVMSLAMLEELHVAFDRAEQDKAVVVLRSARPNIFSAGFDLKIFAAGDTLGGYKMVKAGGELALRLLSFPTPILGVMEGHAFPMGTFLLLASDVRIAAKGPHRMGLNEVAIGIAPPGFAVELARSRIHPAWLSRTVTTGEMFEPEDAVTAGFLDRIVPADRLEQEIDAIAGALRKLHIPSHVTAKRRLRARVMKDMREAIDSEITLAAYEARSAKPSSVVLPRAN
jgi:enoyl-CoA hydratase